MRRGLINAFYTSTETERTVMGKSAQQSNEYHFYIQLTEAFPERNKAQQTSSFFVTPDEINK